MSKYKPTRDYLIIKREEPEEKTSGGLILHDMLQQIKNIGLVVETGEDVKAISVGDRVVFEHHGHTKIFIEDIEHLLTPEHNVLAVINELTE